MATDTEIRVPTHPGLEVAGAISHRLRVNASEGEFGWANPFILPGMVGKKTLFAFGGGIPYVVAEVTETKDNSGTITIGADGLVFTTGGSDDNDIGFLTNRKLGNLAQATANIPFAGMFIEAHVSVSIPDITENDFWFGFADVADPIASAPNDHISFVKTDGAATMVGRVRGNAGTAADSGTLHTFVANQKVRLGIRAYLGTASTTWGEFWVCAEGAGGIPTRTAFTAAQNAQLFAWLTTPTQTIGGLLWWRNGDGNARLLTSSYGWWTQDRLATG